MKIALFIIAGVLAANTLAAVVPDSRILNGIVAAQGEFPYVAEIQVKNVHTCTGFIYNARWVVTTASCIIPYALNDITVHVAQLSLIYEDVDEDSFPVQVVLIHPDYDSVTLVNNIALIELRRDIVFGANVKCIVYDEVDTSTLFSGTIMGWGANRDGGVISTTLRKDENVPIPGDCRFYGAAFDRNTMVCAGDDLHSPCEFDGGVPLVQNKNLVGIFSQDRGCGTSQIASIFTKVYAYFQWLLENAGQQPLADCY